VLVATDVAALRIDVPHIAHVVNYDLPKEAEDFVHRVAGRDARHAWKRRIPSRSRRSATR
jgi:ATP-dependent RNA helicase RhlE